MLQGGAGTPGAGALRQEGAALAGEEEGGGASLRTHGTLLRFRRNLMQS
jgi:hypothetical protein